MATPTSPAAGDDRPPTSGADPQATVGAVPSERIRSVVAPKDGPPSGAVLAYLRLQPGGWAAWLTLVVLQNLRFAPVYCFPLLTGYLIDRIDPAHPERALGELPWILAVTFALCAINVACATLGRGILSRINRTLTAGLRRALIRRLNRLAFAFHDRARAGELQNKFTLDMQRLEGLQNFIAEGLLMYGPVLVVMLAIVAWKNPLLLLVIGAAVPLNLFVGKLLWSRIRSSNEAYRKAESSFISDLGEALAGLRLSRAHAVEAYGEERVGRSASAVADRGIRLDFITNLFGSTAWAVSSFLQMAVVGLGVWLAVHATATYTVLGADLTIERISLGDLTVLLSYYGIVAGAVGAILNGMPSVAAARDALVSLTALWNEEDEERNDGRRPLVPIRGDLRTESVRFAYPGAQAHSLDGMTIHVPAGTSLALVGASGSGKSTLAALILGFYQPQEGRVTVDGHDLREIDRRSIRRQVGVVSQDVVLFRDSVLSNIAWGDQQPDRERARVAAQRANAWEFIERLDGGLDHQLLDRGQGLSGGQRQRLAIARALYRDPRLLILDEATSALDPESERLVQAALDELMRGRTTIIIAHRLSTVRHADAIAVLERGRVVEQGRFDDLLAAGGPFSRLAAGQLG